MRRKAFSGVAIAIALCTATACGTTVHGAAARGASDLSVGGNSGVGAPTATTGAGASGVTGPGAAKGPGATEGALPGTSGLDAVVGGTGGSVPPGKGPLLIGVPDERNAQAANSSVGDTSSDPGNFRTDYTAFVKYINARGGVVGQPRKRIV